MTTDTQALNFLSGPELVRITREHGTPLFVYDQASIERRYRTFAGLPNAFGLTVRYSVKANPNRSILALFNQLGARFDVSSVWEAQRAMRAGVHPDKILMTAQEASSGWEELCALGMEFDAGSLGQLEAYGQRFPGACVSVRINPGFGSGLVKKLTSGGGHSSFGIWHEHLPRVQALLQRHDLALLRLHFHIGSGHEAAVLEATVDKALALCEALPSVSILNLGGGYRLAAMAHEPEPDHHGTASRIAEALTAFAQRTGRQLHLEVEPGTYLMAMCGSLVTRVIDAVRTGDQGHDFIKIDAGLTELIRPSYYGAQHPMVTVRSDGSLPVENIQAMVSGHCCIAGDNLTPRPGGTEDFEPVSLGAVGVGDFLVVERTGGYAASMCLKNFNSYPEAAELLRRDDGSCVLIRVRQTLEQVIQNETTVELVAGTGSGNGSIDGDIEGDVDVRLAPVRGVDLRRQLPRDFFARSSPGFVARFVLAMALLGPGFAAFALDAPLVVLVFAGLLNGLMFAHLVELQHECLHGHAFRSPALNRWFGIACGLFMLSAHSHYRHDHLRHHAWLGTAANKEHFNYRFQNLHTVRGFARAFFDLSRYARVADILWRALTGKRLDNIDKDIDQRRIKQEYVLYALVVAAAVVGSVWAQSWLLFWSWAVPALLISEGVHFLIEMPEHFGLNTQTNPDVLSNTRTITTTPLVSWFVNGNDLHTAHHFHQGVPMRNVHRVHQMIADRILVVEPSYTDFYRRVLDGTVRQSVANTCMAR